VTAGVLLLALAYAAVAALLLNLNLATRHAPWIKTSGVVLVTALYAGSFHGHRALTGWASTEPLPERFRVHWILIEEPDKAGNGKGALYFWARELDEAGLPTGAPRAHVLPWSPARARASEDALARLAAGERLNGELTIAREGAPGDGGGSLPAIAAEDPLGLRFSRVPPPSLPPKPLPDG
jgi:hypothetical protein